MADEPQPNNPDGELVIDVTMVEMKNFRDELEAKETEIKKVVVDMFTFLDTCPIEEPEFKCMKEVVDMLNSIFLACRLIWRRIDQMEKEKKDNHYFKDEILKYKERIGVLFKNMCQKVYQDVEYWYLPVAGGKDELQIFYLIMQSNSKFFIAEFSEELCGVAEKAQKKANEVQTKAQGKVKGISDEGIGIKMLLLFNIGFIQYEVERSSEKALSTAVEGFNMPIPYTLTGESANNYKEMRARFKEAIKSWRPAMIEAVKRSSEQLHPLLRNPSEMTKVEPAVGPQTLEDIVSQLLKLPSRERWWKLSLYASLQVLIILSPYLFTKTKLYAKYKYILPDYAPDILAFVLSLAFFLHVLITWVIILGRQHPFEINASLKIKNIGISSFMVIASVVIGCMFQDSNLKEVLLLMVSVFISLYAIILSYLVSPGFDGGVPDAFSSFALHICCSLNYWWFAVLSIYCIVVQVYKYKMMG